MVDVSVLIVTWNSESYIDKCLASIFGNTKRHTFEVIVVDNGSKDRTAEIVSLNFPDAILVQTGVNLGFSPANNYALGFTKGRYVFLLNPDTYFSGDVVGDLVDFMEAHPEASCTAPKMVEKNGRVNPFQIREFPTVSGAFFAHFGLRKLFPDNNLFAREVMPDFDRMHVREVQFIGGAAMMFRRSVFDDIGLLDEQIPMYFEDLDICARIVETGRKSYFVHTAEVVHLGRMSSNSSPAKPVLHQMENGQAPWLYFRRYRGGLHAAVFTVIIFTSNLLRISLFLPLYRASRRMRPELAGRLKNLLDRARAMVSWSLSDKDAFPERISGIFQKCTDLRPPLPRTDCHAASFGGRNIMN